MAIREHLQFPDGSLEPPDTCDNQGWDADFADGKLWGGILRAACEVLTGDPASFLTCIEVDVMEDQMIELSCRHVGKTCWGDEAYVCNVVSAGPNEL